MIINNTWITLILVICSDNKNYDKYNFCYSSQSIPLLLLQKRYSACIRHTKNVKIQKKFCLISKLPTDDSFADLLLGDSALLLCCSEFRTRSLNSTTVPTWQDLSSFMFVFPIVYALKFYVDSNVVKIGYNNVSIVI